MIFIVEFLKKKKNPQNSLLSKDKLFLEKEGIPSSPPPPIKWYLFCFVKPSDMSFLGSVFSTTLSLETAG